MSHAIAAPLLIRMNDTLRIRRRAKLMTQAFELWLEFTIIVDLAIECDPYGTIFVGHRLMPTRQIDNRKPPKSERSPSSKLSVVG